MDYSSFRPLIDQQYVQLLSVQGYNIALYILSAECISYQQVFADYYQTG